jgi:glucuronokinase
LTATVELEPAMGIHIEPNDDDLTSWDSIANFLDSVDGFGYRTGPQLLAAAVRTFLDVASSLNHDMPSDFRLRYSTTIPRQVGLAGSSALVISTLRCLGAFVDLDIPGELLASVALRAETEQLGIVAGLQDRVVQSIGGLVAMDFSKMEVDARLGIAHGQYEQLDPGLLPPLFVAYRSAAAEPSDRYHRDLRARFDAGETMVIETMRSLANLVTEGRAALRWHDHEHFGALLHQNMELRRGLGPLAPGQIELVDIAESLDTFASFAGSGGAIVGVFGDAAHLEQLRGAYSVLDAELLVL